jgi:hypothetical protein
MCQPRQIVSVGMPLYLQASGAGGSDDDGDGFNDGDGGSNDSGVDSNGGGALELAQQPKFLEFLGRLLKLVVVEPAAATAAAAPAALAAAGAAAAVSPSSSRELSGKQLVVFSTASCLACLAHTSASTALLESEEIMTQVCLNTHTMRTLDLLAYTHTCIHGYTDTRTRIHAYTDTRIHAYTRTRIHA